MTNGSLKGSGAVQAKGNMKSYLNGRTVTSNGQRRAKAGPGFLARTFSIIARWVFSPVQRVQHSSAPRKFRLKLTAPLSRLLTWYSIFSIVFRCPATLEACDEGSPRICRPYFEVKTTVSPYLQPYYEDYVAPYVEVVQPYYTTLDENVLKPSWSYASKHGRPVLLHGQAYGQAQWNKNVQPLISKYQSAAEAQYEQTLGPHVKHISSTVRPYYDIARTNALQTYYEFLLPTFESRKPYVQRAYAAASAFATDSVVPSAVWAWNKTYIFLDGTVWPHLRMVYIENVEPQLVKIGQRLGKYNVKKSSTTPAAEALSRSVRTSSTANPSLTASSSVTKSSSSFVKPSPSASTSATISESSQDSSNPVAQSQAETEVAQLPATDAPRARAEPIPAPEIDPDEKEDDIRRIARETVAIDLKDWQDRYAKAADEGAAEIEERVEEISKRMVRRNARTTGKALVEELRSTVVSELTTLRRHILNIISTVSAGAATADQGHEQIATVVRQAGLAIRDKAQGVRLWREDYELEMQAAITETASNHFRILDGIRDLALQKIGMKWAWMDGVTYKDWAKYHLLKDRFDEWQEDLKQLIVTHPGLEIAQNEGGVIEDDAMQVASTAAKELGRLKQVAFWKIAARDESDEFDSDITRLAAEAAESAEAAAASEHEEGRSESESEVGTDSPPVDGSDASAVPVDFEAITPVNPDPESTSSHGNEASETPVNPDPESTFSDENEASQAPVEIDSSSPSLATEPKSVSDQEAAILEEASIHSVAEAQETDGSGTIASAVLQEHSEPASSQATTTILEDAITTQSIEALETDEPLRVEVGSEPEPDHPKVQPEGDEPVVKFDPAENVIGVLTEPVGTVEEEDMVTNPNAAVEDTHERLADLKDEL